MGGSVSKKRPARKSKSNAKEGHSRSRLPAEPSKAVKSSPGRRRLAAFLTGPAVISGIAGAVPQATIEAAKLAIHEVTTQSSGAKTPKAFRVQSRYNVPIGSGGFIFSGAWGNYANATGVNQGVAVHLASEAVSVAFEDSGIQIASPAEKYRYTQWILSGNMTPAEAAEIFTQESPTPRLKRLVDLIRDDYVISSTGTAVRITSEKPTFYPRKERDIIHQSQDPKLKGVWFTPDLKAGPTNDPTT